MNFSSVARKSESLPMGVVRRRVCQKCYAALRHTRGRDGDRGQSAGPPVRKNRNLSRSASTWNRKDKVRGKKA